MRTGPDKDWEPAYHEGIQAPSLDEEESKKMYDEVIKKLEEKDISTDDYKLLLSLENKQNKLSLPEFCALAVQKEFVKPTMHLENCMECNMEIQEKAFGV